jgi:hypothetical protein
VGSARPRSHEAWPCRLPIENTAWQGHTSPPVPRSSGHPMVGAGCSVNMAKFAVIKIQARSPSTSTVLPLIWVKVLSKSSAATSVEGVREGFSRVRREWEQYSPMWLWRIPIDGSVSVMERNVLTWEANAYGLLGFISYLNHSPSFQLPPHPLSCSSRFDERPNQLHANLR